MVTADFYENLDPNYYQDTAESDFVLRLEDEYLIPESWTENVFSEVYFESNS